MKFLLIGWFLFFTFLFADDLDSLLQKYQSASELSKKTKDENAGHVTVYTRDDLERMQVETLKDVLKSLRFFRYLENRVAQPDILNADPLLYSSKSVRIYLNDNEMVLPVTGSGFILFGNIDMDFIDHVEVYEGFPSFEFGIEPATVVIRLYSKSSKHDEGSRVKVLIGSRGSHKENIYTAGTSVKDIAFYLYANYNENNQKHYGVDGKDVKRNSISNHFYGSFTKGNYKLELQALEQNIDGFLGIVPYAVPESTAATKRFINLALSSKFLKDKSLCVNLSYIYADNKYNANYNPQLPISFGGYSQIEQNNDTQTLTAIIKRTLYLNDHTVSFGLQGRYKAFGIDDIKYDGAQSFLKQAYNQENIYSGFVEDDILLSENNLLSISLMHQYYQRNKLMKNERVTQVRLAYVYSSEQFVSKTFAAHQEFVPEPFMTAAPHVGNPDLLPETYRSLTQEFSYKKLQTLSKFIFGYNNTKRFLLSDGQGVIHNAGKDFEAYYAAFEFTYNFRKKDLLVIGIDNVKLILPDRANHNVEHFDYLIRMINTIGKFDIFNELVINQGYENLATGYDYSAGIKYAWSRDLHISLKGENIFDKGLTRKYYYNLLPTQKLLEVPVIEQKFMLSAEYLF